MRSLAVLIVAIVCACGSSQKPATKKVDAEQERGPLPRHGSPEPDDARTDVAMKCFDRGRDDASTDCVQLSKTFTHDADACEMGCASGKNPNESREHWYMLMTAPPP
jgi:hypothetical protein